MHACLRHGGASNSSNILIFSQSLFNFEEHFDSSTEKIITDS
jgi:hypothetical protein